MSVRVSRTTRAALAAAIALGGGVSTALAVAPAAHAAGTSSVDGSITRSEVIARAQYWLGQSLSYNQGGSAPDSSGRSYRTDCGGYVDMAWHLGSGPNTDGLISYSTAISLDSLAAGDILDSADHVLLFDKWDNPGHTTFSFYSFGSTPVKHVSGMPRGGDGNGNFDSHPASSYTPRRYTKIVDDPAPQSGVAGQLTSVMVGHTAHVFQLTADGHIRINDGNYDAGSWMGWTPLDGSQIISLTAAATGNTVHLFAVTQDGLLHTVDGNYDTHTWNGWKAVDGTGLASINAVTTGNTVHLYGVLQNGNTRSVDLNTDTNTWSGWYDLTGTNVKQLTSAATGNTVRVYAVTNDGLLHERDGDYTAGTWTGWNTVDGSNIKTLTAAATGNTVHLYAATNDGLLHTVDGNYDTHTWNGWKTPDGSLIDQLNAVTDRDTVHLFAHTTDNITHSEDVNYTTNTWNGWYNL